MFRALALRQSKRQLFYSLRWLIHVFNPVVNTKLPAILSHRRSTTVSLETYPFIDKQRTALHVSRCIAPEMGLSWTAVTQFSKLSDKKMPAFLLYPFLRTRDNFNSNTILYYVKLLQAEDNPLRLAFNPLFRNLTYLQAFDSPHSGCSACCHYPF